MNYMDSASHTESKLCQDYLQRLHKTAFPQDFCHFEWVHLFWKEQGELQTCKFDDNFQIWNSEMHGRPRQKGAPDPERVKAAEKKVVTVLENDLTDATSLSFPLHSILTQVHIPHNILRPRFMVN